MIALYIIGGLIALIALLLLCSVSLTVKYEGDLLTVRVGYLFLRFRLLPQKEKRKKQLSEKKTATAAKTKKKKTNAVSDVFSSFESTVSVIKLLLNELADVLKKMRVTRLVIDAKIGGDAAVSAITTGAFNAAVYPFVAWLSTQIYVKCDRINIVPNYNKDSEYYFCAKLKLRPIHALKAAVKILFGMTKLNLKKEEGNKK